jgi:hypothetical protein
MKNALILMPFATIKAFQLPLLALAKILHRNNINVTVIHCQQAMRHGCNAMLASNLGFNSTASEKKKFCNNCLSASKAASKFYPWETRWLKETKRRNNKNNNWIPSNNDLKKISSYEIFSNQKSSNNINKTAKQEWAYRAKTLAKIAPQAANILKEKKYDILLSYNSLYGINNLFTILARKKNITPFSIHEGYHSNKPFELIIQKNNMVENILDIIKLSSQGFKGKLINYSNIKSHIEGIIRGTRPWHYSESITTPKNIKNSNKTSKVLVTLSSNDEVSSARKLGFYKSGKDIFSSQVKWLKWILKFAKNHPSTDFWIRPHPRIYSDKRNAVCSPFAKTLEKIRSRVNANNVIWPTQDQQGSLWKHLYDTTLVINGWSSIGDVFSFFKIPVVCTFPNLSPYNKISQITAKNIGEYNLKMAKLIKSKKRKPNKKLLQKLNLLLSHNTFEIKWEVPFVINYIRKIWPKNKREKFDLVQFTKHAKIQANDEKILKNIQNQAKT